MEQVGNSAGQITPWVTWRTKEVRKGAHRVTWAEIVADDPEMAILFPPAHPEFIRQFRATNPGRLIPLPLPGVVLTAEVFKTMVFDGVRPHNPLPESAAQRARNRFPRLVPRTTRRVHLDATRRVRFGDLPTSVALRNRSTNPFKDILIPPKVTLESFYSSRPHYPNQSRGSVRAERISGVSIAPQSTTQSTTDDLKQMSKDIQDSLDRMITKNMEELARPRSAT